MGDRWLERTSATRYRFMRVERATGRETERIAALKGGTITRNNDVRILEQAEFEVVGGLDLGADLVRVYMECEWPDGQSESVALGTFLAASPSREVHPGYSVAKVKLYGRLQELLSDSFPAPVTVPKGTNAVERAAQMCREAGLEVVADPSDYKTSRERSYGIGAEQSNSETGDTKLDAVNDLLDLAGFLAAKTDPMGRVLMRKYVAPADRPPSWSYEEGPQAKFEGEMAEERDAFDVANHVVVRYASEEETIVSEAWDTDPASEFSTVRVGRTITKGYEYTDVPEGNTAEERQAVADRKARNLLDTAQAVIHRVTIRGAYAPVAVCDSVTLSFPSGGVEGKFEVRTQKLSLKAGCPTETELRDWRR